MSAAAQLNSPTGGQSQQEQGDEESLIIPTAETVKQNYFLDLAIANCIPLGTYVLEKVYFFDFFTFNGFVCTLIPTCII